MHAVERVAGEALPRKSTHAQREEARQEAVQGFSVDHTPENMNPKENTDNPFGTDGAGERPGNTIPRASHDLSIMINGHFIVIKDQIQMYTTNQLISHPLVSPVLQPSLGGLPPLLILTGGGEVLRDEQIYLAHKAANPAKYPPGEAYLDEYPEARNIIVQYKPTDVQLQVWDDLCHVAPTLSFTRPAKYMYRSIAQFGAWALARAQKTGIEIMDDDEVSVISSGSDDESQEDLKKPKQTKTTMKNAVAHGGTAVHNKVGMAGQPLPPFRNHMIRQRVDRHGHLFPLDPPSSLPALQMPANEIGVIKPAPVQKWLEAKKHWDTKYAREKRKIQKRRVKEMAQGYQGFGVDEVPPPSALAGRRGLNMPKEEKKGRSWGMSMWALWGSSHDENTVISLVLIGTSYADTPQITREQKADKEVGTATVMDTDGANASLPGRNRASRLSRSRSRRRAVTDVGQTNNENGDMGESTPPTESERRQEENISTKATNSDCKHLAPPTITSSPPTPQEDTNNKPPALSPTSTNRPIAGGKAFPFKLGTHLNDNGRNASIVTLQSQAGVVTPKGDEKGRQLGESMENRTEEGRQPIETRESEQAEEKEAIGKEQWRQASQEQKMRSIAGDDNEEVVEGRRGTLEDARGVLHHGLAKDQNKTRDDNGNAEGKRPLADRIDTASLD